MPEYGRKKKWQRTMTEGNFNYSSLILSNGVYALQWMPKTADCTKSDIYYVFSTYTYL